MRFWIGGWGPAQGAEAAGISMITAGEADSPLVGGALADRGLAAEAESPSWLAEHPSRDVVYAALEADGRVAAFRRTGETTLAPLGESAEAGAAVCHLAVARDGSHLIASCWGDGRVVRVPLRADGSLGAPRIAPAATDPYAAPASGPGLGESLAGEGAVDAGDLLAQGAAPSDIAALLAGGRVDGADATGSSDVAALLAGDRAGGWNGAMDLRALVADGADPSRVASMLAGRDPDAGLNDLLALLGRGESDPFDDPAVRDILRAADRGEESATPVEPAAPRPSRAHAAVFLPGGRVATTDLGYDLVRIWRTSPAGLVPDHEVVLPHGSGPRHLSLHPSGYLHVITELSCEVFVLGADREGRWRLRGGVPAAQGVLDGDTGAELAVSRDGAVLYAGLRGSDTIAVLRVRGEGDVLEPLALVESGIVTPRHHLVGRDALLIAGQGSSEIVSLPLDARTGVPGRPQRRLSVASPTHILPAR